MPVPIRTDAVREALIPWLGTAVLMQTGIDDSAANLLRSYSPYRMTLPELNEMICNRIFNELYSLLGPRMTIQRDDGSLLRIRLNDLPVLVDDVMGVLFDCMTISPANQQLLMEYAMYQTSLSAMRMLLVKYASSLGLQEQEILKRIIRDNYPPERYVRWMGE